MLSGRFKYWIDVPYLTGIMKTESVMVTKLVVIMHQLLGPWSLYNEYHLCTSARVCVSELEVQPPG